jgi:hypothetical protein
MALRATGGLNVFEKVSISEVSVEILLVNVDHV